MERSTHSQNWDRIRAMRARVRPGVSVLRRHFRKRRAYVLHDPASNQFFRLDAVAFHLVGLLDGRRSIEDAWTLTSERHGDQAPTQGEVVGLIAQLYQTNLVSFDSAADAARLFERLNRRNAMNRRRRMSGFLFVKIPLFDPAVAIEWLLPLVRPLLTRWGLVAWFTLIVAALVQVAPRWGQLWDETTSVLRPSNLVWLVVAYWSIKAVHEFGHGLMCRRFGGEVHEMGIMLLVFAPVPYCDATSSWAIANRVQRALVGLAGILVEVACAATAAIVWANTPAGHRVHELAQNVIFIAGFGTLLFNANPLLRFDGYYVLTDLLDIPNLFKSANAQVVHLVQRWVFGIREARPVTRSRREKAWMLSYACSAWMYRLTVMISILWFLNHAPFLFGLGVILVAVVLFGWVVFPSAKFLHYLVASPSLQGRRLRAVGMTALFVGGLVALIGFVPVDQHAYVDAVIEPPRRAKLAIGTDGFVEHVVVEDGQRVHKGDVILTATNPPLETRRAAVVAEIADQQVVVGQASLRRPDEVLKASARLDALRRQLEQIDRKIRELTLRSPEDGLIVAPVLDRIRGAHAKAGQVLGEVHSGRGLVASAVIDQSDNALMFMSGSLPTAEVRTMGRLDRRIEGKVERVGQAGEQTLKHSQLSVFGSGEIRVDRYDRADPGSLHTVDPVFDVRVRLEGDVKALPGERAKVRFTFGTKPLGAQWWRRLRQMMKATSR